MYENYRNLTVTLEGKVATVTLNRPDAYNAVDIALHDELERVWLDLDRDERVGAIILTGAGKAFSAGGDLKGMAKRAGTPENFRRSLGIPAQTRRLWQNMLEVTPPIIAAVNGDAMGLGATLALMCDITVMSETARIADSHVKVGLVAGDGGAVIWPLLVGASCAKEMLMRGRAVNGKEAREMRLVNHAVPAEQVLKEARAIAEELVALPRWAVAWTKLAVNKQIKAQLNQVLDTSIALEVLTLATDDHREAAAAFLEKRRPDFKGH
ncbi:enoyl-CoA hydratase-related protein [Caballeronia sp. LZ001]|uniref:enoyl-CoA hydratase/isomerase family protein n=1 Tax=Caballeronia sp. LZ001 TaxID=3038553 RepID=UPI0028554E85|nr:enoyl-CoA hydratase-related protein [Caballeronia sp. LZ001]MDR5804854.1 enoyl-CoA hydratase-related protein [Caballeronia sp. LZ001]